MAIDCAIPHYLAASWKGVPFHVDSSSDEFGRRGAQYEYPLSEENGYKDLGRKIRRFKVEGYLIGADQVAMTVAMAFAAESPEPGMLTHPVYGPQLCACVQLTTSIDYRTAKRRTKLSFDLIEAMPSMAPYMIGAAISALFAVGSTALNVSGVRTVWQPTAPAAAVATTISTSLASYVAPASDEESWDAISMLQRGSDPLASPAVVFDTFADTIAPIDNGTATVRRLHVDALQRLRAWNETVVAASDPALPSVESLIVSARLAMIRDYALVAAQTPYTTVKDALDDLDFVMAVYDDEERIAINHCDDVLTVAVRDARAVAAQTILSQNIRLPGVSQSAVDGLWPSLVVAHKLYFDGARYAEVENYNPTMSPFFMGRAVVAPSA